MTCKKSDKNSISTSHVNLCNIDSVCQPWKYYGFTAQVIGKIGINMLLIFSK